MSNDNFTAPGTNSVPRSSLIASMIQAPGRNHGNVATGSQQTSMGQRRELADISSYSNSSAHQYLKMHLQQANSQGLRSKGIQGTTNTGATGAANPQKPFHREKLKAQKILETEQAIEENKKKLAELMRLAELSTGLPSANDQAKSVNQKEQMDVNGGGNGQLMGSSSANVSNMGDKGNLERRVNSREAVRYSPTRLQGGQKPEQTDDDLFTRSKHQSDNLGGEAGNSVMMKQFEKSHDKKSHGDASKGDSKLILKLDNEFPIHDQLRGIPAPEKASSQFITKVHKGKKGDYQRDKSLQPVERTKAIVQKQQTAVSSKRNFTSQESRKRDVVTGSNLVHKPQHNHHRNPFSAQQAMPINQIRQRDLVTKENNKMRKQLQSLTVQNNNDRVVSEEPVGHPNLYQNTSLPDINVSHSTNKSMALRSSKNSSNRNGAKAQSRMVYNGVYENPMVTRKSHGGVASGQSHDFVMQNQQMIGYDFTLPMLHNVNNRLVHQDSASGSSLPRLKQTSNDGHLSQKSIHVINQGRIPKAGTDSSGGSRSISQGSLAADAQSQGSFLNRYNQVNRKLVLGQYRIQGLTQSYKRNEILPNYMQNTASYQNHLDGNKNNSTFRNGKSINLRELARQQELLLQLREEKAHIQSEIAKRQRILAQCSSRGSIGQDNKIYGDNQFDKSATRIQAYWRMKKQRQVYQRMRKQENFDAKYSLQRALAAMEQAISLKAKALDQDKSTNKIEDAVRGMLYRKRFKRSLRRLKIFKRRVEKKMISDKELVKIYFKNWVKNRKSSPQKMQNQKILFEEPQTPDNKLYQREGILIQKVLSQNGSNKVEEFISLDQHPERNESPDAIQLKALADSINNQSDSSKKSEKKPASTLSGQQPDSNYQFAVQVLRELSTVQEMDENGTPMMSTSPKKSDVSNSNDDIRAARIMAALIAAQKENDEKRKQLQEDYEKAKAKFEAEKAILLVAAQESKKQLMSDGAVQQMEVATRDIIDEEDIEESLYDQMSAMKKMQQSKQGVLGSRDVGEGVSQLDQSAQKHQKSMELDSLFLGSSKAMTPQRSERMTQVHRRNDSKKLSQKVSEHNPEPEKASPKNLLPFANQNKAMGQKSGDSKIAQKQDKMPIKKDKKETKSPIKISQEKVQHASKESQQPNQQNALKQQNPQKPSQASPSLSTAVSVQKQLNPSKKSFEKHSSPQKSKGEVRESKQTNFSAPQKSAERVKSQATIMKSQEQKKVGTSQNLNQSSQKTLSPAQSQSKIQQNPYKNQTKNQSILPQTKPASRSDSMAARSQNRSNSKHSQRESNKQGKAVQQPPQKVPLASKPQMPQHAKPPKQQQQQQVPRENMRSCRKELVVARGAAPPQRIEVTKISNKSPVTQIKRQNSQTTKPKEIVISDQAKDSRKSQQKQQSDHSKKAVSTSTLELSLPKTKNVSDRSKKVEGKQGEKEQEKEGKKEAPAPQLTKAQQDAIALKKIEKKINTQAKEEWDTQIGVFKRGEADEQAVEQFAKYYEQVEKRAVAEVPGSEFVTKSVESGTEDCDITNFKTKKNEKNQQKQQHRYENASTDRDATNSQNQDPRGRPMPLRRSVLHPEGAVSATGGNETSGRQMIDSKKNEAGLTFGDPKTNDISADSYSEFGNEFDDDPYDQKRDEKKTAQEQKRRETAQNHLDDLQAKIGQLDGNLEKVITVIESKVAIESQKELTHSDSLNPSESKFDQYANVVRPSVDRPSAIMESGQFLQKKQQIVPPPSNLGLQKSQLPIFNYVNSMDRKQKQYIAEQMRKEQDRKSKGMN